MLSPIQLLKLYKVYKKVDPQLKILQKEISGMTININAGIQILSTVAQIVNIVSPVIPDNKKIWATTVLSIIQALTALFAHYSNPDGTPAAEPFVSPTTAYHLETVETGKTEDGKIKGEVTVSESVPTSAASKGDKIV